MYENDYNNEYYDRDPRRVQLAASPVCMGCEYNKMPYCFAPNSNNSRIDALPPNFMCALKSVQKQVETEKKSNDLLIIREAVKANNKLLKKIIKQMKKWE